MKIAIYTCITEGYDPLVDPSYVDPEVKYLAFISGKEKTQSSVWDVVNIGIDPNLGPVKTARKVKILAHEFIPDFDYSIWVDGNIDIVGDVRSLITGANIPLFLGPRHPFRNCIYSEGNACIKHKKDSAGVIKKQLMGYREQGYPENFGLIETNILFRRHKSPSIVGLMENWWNEVKNKSRRDQLSLNYSIWRTGSDCVETIDCNPRERSDYFKLRGTGIHRGERPMSQRFQNFFKIS